MTSIGLIGLCFEGKLLSKYGNTLSRDITLLLIKWKWKK